MMVTVLKFITIVILFLFYYKVINVIKSIARTSEN